MSDLPIFDYFEEPRKKKSKKEDTRFYSIFGVRRKELSPKRRRGLIRSSLRRNVLRTTKPRDVLKTLTKVRKTKDRVKPEPRYYFEVHKILRRRSRY